MTSVKLALAALAIPLLLAARARAADAPKPEDFPEADRQSNAPFDEFQSKPRHVNLRIDPVAPFVNFDLFLKQWGATVDFALLRDITLGPSIRGGPSYKQGDSFAFVHKLGITGGYYMNGTKLTDSFVIWPSWYFWAFSTKNAALGDQILDEMDCREISVLAGYQWFYQQGWNINLAAGLKYRYRVRNVTIIGSSGLVIPSDLATGLSFSAELMLGWAK